MYYLSKDILICVGRNSNRILKKAQLSHKMVPHSSFHVIWHFIRPHFQLLACYSTPFDHVSIDGEISVWHNWMHWFRLERGLIIAWTYTWKAYCIQVMKLKVACIFTQVIISHCRRNYWDWGENNTSKYINCTYAWLFWHSLPY